MKASNETKTRINAIVVRTRVKAGSVNAKLVES